MKMRLVSFLIFSLSICFINKSISQKYEKVNGLWNAAFVDLPISKKIYAGKFVINLIIKKSNVRGSIIVRYNTCKL